MAYATTEDDFKKYSGTLNKHRAALEEVKKRSAGWLKRTDLRHDARLSIMYANELVKSARVVRSSRDCVAVTYVTPFTGTKVSFGFRGTAITADYGVDAKLALNARHIRRLDEARQFVKNTVQQLKIKPLSNGKWEKLTFHGHSLGGFIAEGVGNDWYGGFTGTVQSGAPVIKIFGQIPASYNKPKRGSYPAVRFVRSGDVVTMGMENMGNGIIVKRPPIKLPKKPSSWTRTATNLRQSSNMFSRGVGSVMGWLGDKAHKVKQVFHQHSMANYLPWLEDVITQSVKAQLTRR